MVSAVAQPYLSNVRAFLESPQVSKSVMEVPNKTVICTQGQLGDTVFFIRQGAVKLAVLNKAGKEAILTIVRSGEFFGEGCLVGQTARTSTSIAVLPSTLFSIHKSEMARLLRESQYFCDRFLAQVLVRTMRMEEDLTDQLFNSLEKRLARSLLLLTHFGMEPVASTPPLKISHEMLAEMIGASRERVSRCMSRFTKLGFIKTKGGLRVDPSLLTVLLRD